MIQTRTLPRLRVRASRATSIVWTVVVVILALTWMRTLAPQSIGGPAGYVMIRGTSMLPTYKTGDLVIVHRHASYEKGDIVAYRVPKGQPGEGIIVIHRIVGGSVPTGFVIKGDNNSWLDDWRPTAADVVGEAFVHVPRLGLLLAFLHAPVPLASLAAGVVIAMIAVPKQKEAEKRARPRGARPFDGKLIRSAASVAVVAGALLLFGGGVTFAGSKPHPRHTAHPACAATQSSGATELSEADIVNITARCRAAN